MPRTFIDLSHTIEPGMLTYKGLPAPHICDFLSRENAIGKYAEGVSFSIQSITMVGNTGTYLDSPFHRYAEGADLAQLHLNQLADLPILLIHRPYTQALATTAADLAGHIITGHAVLIHTGWDVHWRTETYFENHPYLTEDAAHYLANQGATLVGIDSHNIDDTRGNNRPAHSILLGANIPICEHMTNLAALPPTGARLHAVPPKMAGIGTFPVRAFAHL